MAELPGVPRRENRSHNLPVQLTSFVGREAELDAANWLLGRARLVTLTDPGGTGKTQLGIRLAAEVLDRY
jgi:hypothetical protein